MQASTSRVLDGQQRFTVARQLGARFGERLAPADARRGRGAVSNATGRFEPTRKEEFDDGWDRDETIEALKTEVTLESDAPIRVMIPRGSPEKLTGKIVYVGPLIAPVAGSTANSRAS